MTTWRVRLQDADGRQRGARVEAEPGADPAGLGVAVRRLGLRGRPLRLRGREITTWPTMESAGVYHGDVIQCGEPYAGPAPAQGARPSPGRHLVVLTGPDAGGVVRIGPGRWVIGRSQSSDIAWADPEVSARHAVLDVVGDEIRLVDTGSTNGTWCEGRRLEPGEHRTVDPGDYLAVGGTTFTVADFGPSDLAVVDRSSPPHAVVQRHFRPALEPLPSRLSPPAKPHRRESTGSSWWRALTPLATGVGFALVTGRWEFLLISALAPVLFVFDARRARRRDAERQAAELAAHTSAIRAHRSLVDELRRTERDRRRDQAALGGMAIARLGLPHRRLWERRPGDTDFLSLDIGLASRPVVTLSEDDPATGPPRHWLVPLDTSLPDIGSVAVVGGAARTRAVLRGLVLNLVSTHAPSEIRLWVFCSPDRVDEWEFCRWLPHAIDEELRARLADDTTAAAERLAQLSPAPRTDTDTPDRSSDHGEVADIVVVDQGAPLSAEALADLLTTTSPRRMSTLVATPSGAPSGAGARLDLLPDGSATFHSTTQPLVSEVRVAEISADRAHDAAVTAASFRCFRHRVERPNASPRLLDLLGIDRLDPAAIEQGWRRHGSSTEAIVGTRREGPMTIDIAKHGPHGLIGGMSGSGKTELLMTLVSALCVRNHPDDLAVAIVDFKGGVDHGLTGQLPHVIDVTTNHDPAQFSRTVELLDAEQRRRQQLFNGVGADLEAYRAARASRPELPAVPRLLVIVDEFSELLASEEGKHHLDELIRVTRIGRALGVHLLLVTQNFEGQLPPQIEANAGLRICLRVMKANHSKVVLGTGAAADLDERCIGRALARLNGRDVIEFQTARVVGRRPGRTSSEPDAHPIGRQPIEVDWLATSDARPPSRSTAEAPCPMAETDLYALVDTLGRAAEASGWSAHAVPWPGTLPSEVTLDHLLAQAGWRTSTDSESIDIPFALEDRPDEQEQRVLTIGSHDGDILLVGGPQSGTGDALATLAVSAATVRGADDLHLHVIDLEGGGLAALSGLPHLGTAAVRDERLTRRLLRELDAMVASRRMVRHHGAGSTDLGPHQLVLVAGADRLVRRGEERHPLLDPVLRLMLDASGLGVQFVLAGLPNLAESRLAANVGRRFVFRCPTSRQAIGLGVPRSLAGFLDQPGRAVDTERDRLVQVATAGHPAAGRGTVALADPAPGRTPLRLRTVAWPLSTESVEIDTAPSGHERPFPLGVGHDSGEVCWIDAAEDGPVVVVTGPPRSGRTTALISLAALAVRLGWRCLAIGGSRRSALAADSMEPEAQPGLSVFDRLLRPDEIDQTLHQLVGRGPGSERQPVAVFLDDAHRLDGGQLDPDRLVAADLVVMAGTLDFVAGRSPFRRSLPPHRAGLLLNPTAALDGQAVGLTGRVPDEARGGRPGMGLAVVAGEPTAVTLPVPPAHAARA